MIRHLLHVDFEPGRGLQEQVRETLVNAILSGIFAADTPLPSCRQLASQLRVSRNTTALVFESLVNEGYLISRPRSGYYLHPDYHEASPAAVESAPQREAAAPRWGDRLQMTPSQQESILKPAGWMHYRYPFIYGQPDTRQFPLATWRSAANWLHGGVRDPAWVIDHIDQDVPMLIEQIRTRVLPKRGIVAAPDEILITLGSQNALYLLTRLLLSSTTRIGVENPCFREAINTFLLADAEVVPHPVDEEGIVLNERPCDYYYVTPGHQVPTGVTMSSARRRQLLEHAARHDAVIIEDDYDSESNFTLNPLPALKASDRSGRVVYVSSLSKALSPGLRLGFMVADPDLIDEARALRDRVAGDQMPTVSAGTSVNRRGQSKNGPLPVGSIPGLDATQTIYDAGFDAAWEADLFGAKRRALEGASARLQATEVEAQGVRMRIVAEVARTWFTAAGARYELHAQQATLDTLQQTLELVRLRHALGDASAADVEAAYAQWTAVNALLPDIQARQRAAVLGLGVLLGAPPERELALLDGPLAPCTLRALPVGERADLLRRRPDVLAAERRLAASSADIGVATAELFPKLSIGVGGGFQALSTGNWFDASSSRFSILPLISWRLFDGGRVRAEIRAREAAEQQAALAYEQAVLAALGDAERALGDYHGGLDTLERRAMALDAARTSYGYAKARYAAEIGRAHV